MMNMNLLAVVTLPSIYHGCSTHKTFWEEKTTGEEKLFSAVKMKNCVCRNVRKKRRSRVVTIMPPWKYHLNLVVWKR